MRLTYDPENNVAYLYVQAPGTAGQVDTVCVADDLNVDVDADGRVFGIEFLDANRQLAAVDPGQIVVQIAGTAADHSIPLLGKKAA